MSWFKHKHKWEAIRALFPYPEGYATYCPGCRTVLDTGLTKKHAEEAAEELNTQKEVK